MVTALNDKVIGIGNDMAHFARRHVAHRSDLLTVEGFPFDIWNAMAEQKLLGVGTSEYYGGTGGTYLAISVAGQALMRHGYNMGLSLSWLIHNVVSRFAIAGLGSDRQQEEYLPDLAEGIKTASIAISEPEARAHPKYLTTSASYKDGYFLLNGIKSFLTNGTIADFYVILAITGIENDRKRYSAFIVPRTTKGLSITKELHFDFLRPSPHCEITLTDCPVPTSNMLGEQGTAYATLAKPFREVEETCFMGPIVGGLERQLELLINLIRQSKISRTDQLKSSMGELRFHIDSLRVIAYEAARMLDSGIAHPEFPSLLLYFRNMSGRFQSFLKTIMTDWGIRKDRDLSIITNDLIHTIDIAKYVAQIKQQQLGETLLSERKIHDTNAK